MLGWSEKAAAHGQFLEVGAEQLRYMQAAAAGRLKPDRNLCIGLCRHGRSQHAKQAVQIATCSDLISFRGLDSRARWDPTGMAGLESTEAAVASSNAKRMLICAEGVFPWRGSCDPLGSKGSNTLGN